MINIQILHGKDRKDFILEIKFEDLKERIETEDYLQDMESVKYSDLTKSKKKIKELATKLVKETASAIKHDSLIQTQISVAGRRAALFSLEVNIINLPYANYKKISNFVNEDEAYPVNVYVETRSEYINVSGFRIDELASGDDLVAHSDDYIMQLAADIEVKLQEIKEYQKPEKKTASKKG